MPLVPKHLVYNYVEPTTDFSSIFIVSNTNIIVSTAFILGDEGKLLQWISPCNLQ